MCKRGDTFSLAILIGRGLDHINLVHFTNHFFNFVQFSGCIENDFKPPLWAVFFVYIL